MKHVGWIKCLGGCEYADFEEGKEYRVFYDVAYMVYEVEDDFESLYSEPVQWITGCEGVKQDLINWGKWEWVVDIGSIWESLNQNGHKQRRIFEIKEIIPDDISALKCFANLFIPLHTPRSEHKSNPHSVLDNTDVALPPEIHNNRPIASIAEIMKITKELCAGGGTVTNNLKGKYDEI